ncbi:MAG: hypothetical protein JWO30_1306 [Fibrobacteres bacterium]|nr:hypothetical protein [Fibrobacterota bacterium]
MTQIQASLSLLIIALSAQSGFSDPAGAPVPASQPSLISDYPGKPVPIMLSPFALPAVPIAPAAQSASHGSLAMPDLESEGHRHIRVAAESAAKVVGTLAYAGCILENPLSIMACPQAGPSASRY